MLLIAFYVWMFRRAARRAGIGGGLMGIGKSKARRYDQESDTKVTFADVAGIDEARERARRDRGLPARSRRSTRASAEPLPKACCSSARRARARRCSQGGRRRGRRAVLLDERGRVRRDDRRGRRRTRPRPVQAGARERAGNHLRRRVDAIGRARGPMSIGGSSEQEQTLNQILTEMDGFSSREGMIVLARDQSARRARPGAAPPGPFRSARHRQPAGQGTAARRSSRCTHQVYTAEGVLVPVTVIQAGPLYGRRDAAPGARRLCGGATRLRSCEAQSPGEGVAGPVREGRHRDVQGAAGVRPRGRRCAGRRDGATRGRCLCRRRAGAGDRRQQGARHGGRDEALQLRRLSRSHGTHEYFRHGGSIGNRSYPGRVLKGKRMAGRMGAVRVTTRNLQVVAVRPDEDSSWCGVRCPGRATGPSSSRRPAPGSREPQASERRRHADGRGDDGDRSRHVAGAGAGRGARGAGRRPGWPGARASAARDGEEPARITQGGYRGGQDPSLRERWRQEAVQAEGHRQRPGGQHAIADMAAAAPSSSRPSHATTRIGFRVPRGSRRCAACWRRAIRTASCWSSMGSRCPSRRRSGWSSALAGLGIQGGALVVLGSADDAIAAGGAQPAQRQGHPGRVD